MVGAVRGLVEEAPWVESVLTGSFAGSVALGLSPEDVTALERHFLEPQEEPEVPLSPSETAYARALARFGEVRLPSPSYVAALRWAHVRGIPVAGVDPSSDHYADLFVGSIGATDLLREGFAERSLARAPLSAPSAVELARIWDRRLHPGRGHRKLMEASDGVLVKNLEELARRMGPGAERMALILDVERTDRLLPRLTEEGWPYEVAERPTPEATGEETP